MTCFRITPNELAIIIRHLRSDQTSDEDRQKYLKLFQRSVPGQAPLALLEQAIALKDTSSDFELAQQAFTLRN